MRSHVAIVGEMASGKTTVSDALVRHHGYTRLSLARGIKEIGARLYGGGHPIEKNGEYEVYSNVVFDTVTISGRQLLQDLGQVVKDFDRDFWLRWLQADIKSGDFGPGPFVIDDCRFPFEADALYDWGFRIVKLEVPEQVRLQRYFSTYGRLPTPTEMNHPSETEVRRIEAEVYLDGERDPDEVVSMLLSYL